MSTVLRFEDDNTKAINKERVKQQRVIPVGTLLYTSSVNLPRVLSQNTLLFTTDTRELYIGTGTGIARVNIGSDGEIIDKGDYLLKTEAAQYYVQKEYLDPSSVVTDQEMQDAILPLSQKIADIIADNKFKADKEDVFTKGESNERFVDNEEFEVGMSKKVEQEILTPTGNHAFVKNLPTGVTLKFQNIGNDVESYINVGKNSIILYSKRTKDDELGGHIYITPSGVFYTHDNNTNYGMNDEILTMADLTSIEQMYSEIISLSRDTKAIALQSAERARISEEMVNETKNYIENAVLQSTDAFNLATEAIDTSNRIESQLLAAYTNSTSSLQKSITANETANNAKIESSDAMRRLTQFQNSISQQFQQIVEQVNSLITGEVPDDDGRRTIMSVEVFDELIEVPYNTEAADLQLPTSVRVTLDDNTTRTIPVTWKFDVYQNDKTEYSQNLVGILSETSEVKNPNYMFALITVKVMPEVIIPDDDDEGWEVIFAMPSMCDTIPDFGSHIGHPELTSEDVMGTFDDFDNYVEPTVQMFFIGTLRNLNTNLGTVQVLDPISRSSLVNEEVTNYAPSGFRVPIYGVSSDEDIRNYQTQIMTLFALGTNGAVSYSEGNLIFSNATQANSVYIIKKIPLSGN